MTMSRNAGGRGQASRRLGAQSAAPGAPAARCSHIGIHRNTRQPAKPANLLALGLTLDGWPDGEVADLDIARLVDREGDGTGDGLRRDGELGHALADLLAGLRVVDGVGQFGADVAG